MDNIPIDPTMEHAGFEQIPEEMQRILHETPTSPDENDDMQYSRGSFHRLPNGKVVTVRAVLQFDSTSFSPVELEAVGSDIFDVVEEDGAAQYYLETFEDGDAEEPEGEYALEDGDTITIVGNLPSDESAASDEVLGILKMLSDSTRISDEEASSLGAYKYLTQGIEAHRDSLEKTYAWDKKLSEEEKQAIGQIRLASEALVIEKTGDRQIEPDEIYEFTTLDPDMNPCVVNIEGPDASTTGISVAPRIRITRTDAVDTVHPQDAEDKVRNITDKTEYIIENNGYSWIDDGITNVTDQANNSVPTDNESKMTELLKSGPLSFEDELMFSILAAGLSGKDSDKIPRSGRRMSSEDYKTVLAIIQSALHQ